MSFVRPALVLLVVLAATACGGGSESPTTEGDGAAPGDQGPAPIQVRGDADLVIWSDNLLLPAMRQLGDQFGQENGVAVEIVEVGDRRALLQQAGPAGEGPDIILGANDWIGELITNGAIAPIDLPNADEFRDVAIEGYTWDGRLYGVPFAVENLALFRNTELVPEAPQTWQDVVDVSLELQESGAVEQAFLIPSAPEESPYHFHPIFTGYGGYIFGMAESGYDTSDVGVDSEGGIEAAQAVGEWVDQGFINPDVTYQIMQERFGQGEGAFAVVGPWGLVQDGAGFEETGVPFEVQAFPPLQGNTMQPFVGIQGLMVSAFADNALLAQSFVTEFMTTMDAQMALFESNNRPPALISAAEQVQQDNPTMAAFGEAAEDGVPLPAVPAMSTVFSALGDAWTLVFNQQNPEQAMQNAAQTVRDAAEQD